MRKVREEEMSVTGCGLLGFVNAKGLGPDPKGRLEPPKDLRQGRPGFGMHAGNFLVATRWRADWQKWAWEKGRELRLVERGAWW